jgi:hypothetical protein
MSVRLILVYESNVVFVAEHAIWRDVAGHVAALVRNVPILRAKVRSYV